MSPAARVLIALAAGLAIGFACTRVPALAPIPSLVAPVGQLWLRAIQMTVIPLVVSLLVTGICTAAPTGMLGRQGVRLAAWFAGLLLAAAMLAAVVVPTVLQLLPLPDISNAVQSTSTSAVPAAAPAGATPSWIDAVLPLNPIRAAADGAMLPLVVFTLLFAFALVRVERDARETVIRFFRGVVDAMLVLVGWVLLVAPIGVFAIAVPLVGKAGGHAAGAVATYVALETGVLLVVATLALLFAARAARRSLPAFVRAMLPALTIAATTRSSVASLPIMLETAKALGVSQATAGFALPLAVTLFRVTTPPAAMTTTLFAAHFHGVTLGVGTIVLLVLASVLLSAGVVGVPGQASFFITRLPMFAIAGLPLDLLAPLLAVDLIPDIVRTTGNVTADVGVSAALEPRQRAIVGGLDEGTPATPPDGAYAGEPDVTPTV